LDIRFVVNTENNKNYCTLFGHHIQTGAGNGKAVPAQALHLYDQVDKHIHAFLLSALHGDE